MPDMMRARRPGGQMDGAWGQAPAGPGWLLLGRRVGADLPVMSGVTDQGNALSHRLGGQSGFSGGRELPVVGRDEQIGSPDFCSGDMECVGGTDG